VANALSLTKEFLGSRSTAHTDPACRKRTEFRRARRADYTFALENRRSRGESVRSSALIPVRKTGSEKSALSQRPSVIVTAPQRRSNRSAAKAIEGVSHGRLDVGTSQIGDTLPDLVGHLAAKVDNVSDGRTIATLR
jgi:hypothetical protein